MSKYSQLDIFTTNYDTIVETVCEKNGLDFDDGFDYSKKFGLAVFNPRLFERSRISLWKLAGSSNWWSKIGDQTIFKLNLELEGFNHINHLMIMPGQEERFYQYPFNILHCSFTNRLQYVKELIAIGHKFADNNILSAINYALETRDDFRLIIVNPQANLLRKVVFSNNPKVIAKQMMFEEWLKDIDKYVTIAKAYSRSRMQEQNEIDKNTRTKIINEYMISQDFKTEITKAIDKDRQSRDMWTAPYILPRVEIRGNDSENLPGDVFYENPISLNMKRCSKCNGPLGFGTTSWSAGVCSSCTKND